MRASIPDRTRTCNLRLRRPTLYPIQLRGHRPGAGPPGGLHDDGFRLYLQLARRRPVFPSLGGAGWLAGSARSAKQEKQGQKSARPAEDRADHCKPGTAGLKTPECEAQSDQGIDRGQRCDPGEQDRPDPQKDRRDRSGNRHFGAQPPFRIVAVCARPFRSSLTFFFRTRGSGGRGGCFAGNGGDAVRIGLTWRWPRVGSVWRVRRIAGGRIAVAGRVKTVCRAFLGGEIHCGWGQEDRTAFWTICIFGSITGLDCRLGFRRLTNTQSVPPGCGEIGSAV